VVNILDEKSRAGVTFAKLENRLHEVNAIKTGIKLFSSGKVTFCRQGFEYMAAYRGLIIHSVNLVYWVTHFFLNLLSAL